MADLNSTIVRGKLRVTADEYISGNLNVTGTLTGNGSGLTSLNGSNISSGTVAFARLPTGTGASQIAIGNHTHSYAGSSSAGGAANSVKASLTFNNGGSGAASGTTFNGSEAKTISYNTIGAAPAVTGGYLPLSGGTLTGVLSMLANQYTDSLSTGALNMNNSDIYGLNSIKFADASDNAGEGIHFYRDATHADTLWDNGGVLYYVPNRAFGTSTTAANSNVLLHSGNYSSYALPKTGANYNTATKTNYFKISRNGGDKECLAIGVDDNEVLFDYLQDETTANFTFVGRFDDSEGGGGAAAGSHTFKFNSSSSGASITIDGTALLKSTDISAWAKAATKPSYTHNEIGAGNLTVGNGSSYLNMRSGHDSYDGGIYYSTPGNEAMIFAVKSGVTSFIFKSGLSCTSTGTSWQTLTPDLQIKNGKVTINKLIANNEQGSYNLDVNGTINGTTLYENAVSLERKYLKRDVYEVDSITRPTNSSNYVVYHITAPAITELTNGLTVRVHKGLASDNSSTDGSGALKLLQINNLTPIAIFWRYNSFAAWNNFDNVSMTLTYSSAARPSSSDYYGYTSTAGFILDFTYDSGNDTYNLYDYGGYYTGSVALTTYSIVGWDTSGKRIPIVQSNGTFSNLSFDFGKGIQYWDGSAYAANSNKGPWNGYTWYPRVMASIPAAFISAFSLNTVTTKDRFYLKCTKSGTTLTATGVVKALPSSNDGFYYMLFAKPYQDYTNSTGAQNWTFFITQPIYYYTDKLYVFNDTSECVKGPGFNTVTELSFRDHSVTTGSPAVTTDYNWKITCPSTAVADKLILTYDNLDFDDKTVVSLQKTSGYVDMYLQHGSVRLKDPEAMFLTNYNVWDDSAFTAGIGLAMKSDSIIRRHRDGSDFSTTTDFYSFPEGCGSKILTENFIKDNRNDRKQTYTSNGEMYFNNSADIDSDASAFVCTGSAVVRAAQKTFAIVMTPLMNINGYDISSTYSTVSGTQGNYTYIGIKYNDSELITPTRAKYYLWRMTGSTHLPLYSTEAQQGNPQYSYMVDADYNFYKIQYHPNVDTSGSVSKGYLRLWKLPGIFDRSIDINAGNGAYAYGIRIHPYNASNYAGIVLCDSTNTGTTGTATNTWWIRNKAGTLNIGKNSTDLLTHASTKTGWVFSGNVTATSFYASSDRRLKDNIKQSDLNFLDIINALKIKEFTFKTDEDKENKYLGLIAQQLRDELPEKYRKHMISESSDKKHTLSINEGKVQYITMGAVQQLSKTIDKQQKRIDELEAENKELKKTLKEINKKLDALLK